MTNKSWMSLFSVLKNAVFIVPNIFSLVTHVVSLTAYETKLAVRSLLKIILLLFVLALLAIGTWFGLLAMFYIFLMSVHWSPLTAMGLILLVNVIALIIVALIIFEMKKNLNFSGTKQQLQIIKNLYQD